MEEKNSEKKERKMRDSGIPWIGEVPEGWKVVPLKYLLSNETNSLKVGPFGSQLSGSDFTDDGYWVYNQRSVLDKNFDSNDTFISEPKFNSMNSFKVDENDILITTRGTIGKICRIPQNYHKGIIHPCIIKFRINESLLMYSLLEKIFNESDLVKKQFEINSNATTIDVIYGSTLRNILIPVPPVQIQHSIADFLDSKCSEIDTLIENLRARVESAKEYKKAVITEAVTKGLDKDTKMKDSGIEWIGEMPEGWEIVPAKYLFSNSDKRKSLNDEQLTSSQKYGIITQKEYMQRENAKIVMATQGIEKWKHVEPNDFIISLRSFQGGLEMSEITGCITWHYVVLKPVKEIIPRYYKWFFKSDVYIKALQNTCNFIRDGQDLRYSNFVQVPLIDIPLKEQYKIADYLDSKCSEIDALLQNYEDQISTLEEYKKSLIYEYVTGKKEVY